MSALGLFNVSNTGNPLDFNPQSVRNSGAQQLRQDFQQLGRDLQSGNLTAAQTYFSTLQQNGPQSGTSAAVQSGNSVSQQLQQLSEALQSGNLSAAQQDYTSLFQGFQSLKAFSQTHHHAAGIDGAAGAKAGAINGLFTQLGQALQSGSPSAAQQAYASLQQDFQQFTPGIGLFPSLSTPGSSAVSVIA